MPLIESLPLSYTVCNHSWLTIEFHDVVALQTQLGDVPQTGVQVWEACDLVVGQVEHSQVGKLLHFKLIKPESDLVMSLPPPPFPSFPPLRSPPLPSPLPLLLKWHVLSFTSSIFFQFLLILPMEGSLNKAHLASPQSFRILQNCQHCQAVLRFGLFAFWSSYSRKLIRNLLGPGSVQKFGAMGSRHFPTRQQQVSVYQLMFTTVMRPSDLPRPIVGISTESGDPVS